MAGEPASRVLVIGLDGATFRVIMPMVQAGELPALAKLMREGAYGTLRSTVQPSSEQAWVTFMTGVQNGKHGIFGFVQRAPGSYAYHYTNARSQRARTLWRILSDRGRQVISVNVPMTYPPEPVNGVLIGGLMTPSERSRFTYPPDIYEELKREVGGYIINVDIETGKLKDAGEAALLSQIEAMIRLRTDAVKYLAQTRPWDLLCVVYGAADRVSHKFWRYFDGDLKSPGTSKGDVIPQVYRWLDQSVAALVDSLADERTLTLIVSDHGFGPLNKAFYLNHWLAQRGYLAWRRQSSLDLGLRMRSGVNALLKRAVHWIDIPWLRSVKSAAFAQWPGLKGKLHSSMAYGQVDWRHTSAYGSGTMGNIYLNVKGREPQGTVAPGTEYESLRDVLIEELREIVDDATGKPIFHAVYRREDIYWGPYLEIAPDIIGLLDPTYHVAAVDWREAGDNVIVPLGDQLLFVGDLSGQHDMDGILVAAGYNVRAGAQISEAGIVDMAPTILAALGEDIPGDMDGTTLDALFVEPFAGAHGAGDSTSTSQSADEREDGYSQEEEAEVAARLRGLGYVD